MRKNRIFNQSRLGAYADPFTPSGPEIQHDIAKMSYGQFNVSWLPMLIDLMASGDVGLGEVVRVLVDVRKRYRQR